MKKPLSILLSAILLCIFIIGCGRTNANDGNEKKTDSSNVSVKSDNDNTIKKTGLLLGLSQENSEGKEQILSTYWIIRNGDDIEFKSKDDKIITPYNNDFWVIEKNKFVENKLNDFAEENKETYQLYDYEYKANATTLTSHLINENNKPYLTKENFFDKLKLDMLPYNETYEKILYVGNKYVSTLKNSFSMSGGTWNMTEYDINFYDVKELNNKVTSVNLLNFPDAKINELKKNYNKVVEDQKYDNGEPFIKIVNEIDEKNSSIKHIQGKWKAVIPYSEIYEHYGNGSSHSTIIDYIPVDVDLDKNIVGDNELAITWDTIKEKIPEAVDAVSSPNKDMLLVLTQNKLAIYLDPVEKGIDKADAEIELKENQSIVMEQWISDEKTDEWNSVLKEKLN